MSEADNPTNSSLPEQVNSVDSTTSDQANSCYFDSPDETLLPNIVPGSQAENQQFVDCAPSASWVEMNENGLAAIAPAEIAHLVDLIQIQDLRSANSNLLNRVEELTQTLAEYQATLELHQERSQAAESMLTEKTHELSAAQEQVKEVSQELEVTHQTVQRQQILIETLTAHLESSQERVAQLERECSLTQADYNEQSHQLIQTDNKCRELRSRLTRQQRYTVQLKIALEKCLEVPIPSYQFEADIDSIPTNANFGQVEQPIPLQSLFPKAEPIPPWSAQPQTLNNQLEPTCAEFSGLLREAEALNYPHSSKLDCLDEDLNTFPAEEPVAVVETFDLFSLPTPAELSESVIEPAEIYASTEDILEATEAELQELLNLLVAVEEQVTVNFPEDFTVEPYNAPDQMDESLKNPNQAIADFSYIESEPVSLDRTAQIQFTQLPQQETSSFTRNSNWPSPVVYPSHPPKRRKSLAAIELPTFSQK